MKFIAPLLPLLRGRRPNLAQPDRHRPGYFRDYHQRNLAARRAYLSAKARQYRREKRRATTKGNP